MYANTYVADHDLLAWLSIVASSVCGTCRGAVWRCCRSTVSSQRSSCTSLVGARVVGVQVLAGKVPTRSGSSGVAAPEPAAKAAAEATAHTTAHTTKTTTEGARAREAGISVLSYDVSDDKTRHQGYANDEPRELPRFGRTSQNRCTCLHKRVISEEKTVFTESLLIAC